MSYYYIDTHSHIYSEQFDEDRDDVIERANNANVNIAILPAISAQYHKKMIDITHKYKGLYATIGVHPTDIKEDYKRELDVVKDYLYNSSEKFVAIGEIGLDLYWDKTFLNEQIEALETQLNWCVDKKLPAIIHTRDAYPDMINVIKRFQGTSLRVIFHSFSGTIEDADTLLSLGNHLIGIGGVVTFKKSNLIDIVRHVGLERIVLETDAPYLAPAPYRGKRNESCYIPIIAEYIAQHLNVTVEDVATQTTNNAKDIFSI